MQLAYSPSQYPNRRKLLVCAVTTHEQEMVEDTGAKLNLVLQA